MWWKICCFTGAALLWSSGMMSWAQQSTSQQPALQRDDPATSGAGPTSRAPGQLDYDSPKDVAHGRALREDVRDHDRPRHQLGMNFVRANGRDEGARPHIVKPQIGLTRRGACPR